MNAAARRCSTFCARRCRRDSACPRARTAAITQVFTDAAAAGQRAIVATVTEDVPNPPSCTLVAAVLEDGVVHYCGLGDSRVYLLPDAGDGQILTVDDSMAQVLIAGGTPRAEAEASKQAHSITKWLGKDGTDIVPRVGQVEVTGPGWLLACSDGLWNYASEPSRASSDADRGRRDRSPTPAFAPAVDNIAVTWSAFAERAGRRQRRPKPDNMTVVRDGAGPPRREPVGNNAPDGGESHG